MTKRVMQGLGVVALLVGLLWLGQGLGLIMWPRESFMLGKPVWSVWGTLLAVAGVLLLVLAGRRR